MALVEIVAPTLATELAGNSVTAQRYVRLFRELWLSTSVTGEPSGRSHAVVALNAFRTAGAITVAAESSARGFVVLTGTDVYRFMATDRAVVMGSLDRSDRLVGLNDRVGECLEPRHRYASRSPTWALIPSRCRARLLHRSSSSNAVAYGVAGWAPGATEAAVPAVD